MSQLFSCGKAFRCWSLGGHLQTGAEAILMLVQHSRRYMLGVAARLIGRPVPNKTQMEVA
jgi:hypothetical protein